MIESEFKHVMAQASLGTKDTIIGDGVLHRFHVEGDSKGQKNGWYILYSDGVPAGSFGSWKTGETHSWCAKAPHDLTPIQCAENKQRIEAARQAREAEGKVRQQEARNKALFIWKAAPAAPNSHPYLSNKEVSSHGLRIHKGLLVIPLRDGSGALHSLQFIDGDGNKRFLSGGRKAGCYFAIGTPADTLCIAEGYATAASIYDSTGHAVAVAFDAGNLMQVTQALRTKFPLIEITLCADNDVHTDGNPGLTKAREAAASVGALLSVPPMAGDFNDFLRSASE
ncbi:MAG: hypothetical protein COB36_14010 [Alphaproteobacteria bacterium]|nr:MAG: hypothetical protein COB36_14010 [Alphaproteobacteria bacterium]